VGCSYVSLWLVVFDLSMIDFLLFDHFFAFATATFATSTCIANLRTAYGVFYGQVGNIKRGRPLRIANWRVRP